MIEESSREKICITNIKAIFNVDDKGEQENLMETIRKLEKALQHIY